MPDATVPELFEAQVARTPAAIAVEFGEQSLSYAGLNARANQVAHYLIGLGVGPEALVGIALERSIEMIVAVLGVLKAGAAYLPLDPAYPKARLDYIVSDAKLRERCSTTRRTGSRCTRGCRCTIPRVVCDRNTRPM